MPSNGHYRRCAFAAFALSAVAFAGCQSSNSSNSAQSSFDVSMAAVTEADFAQRHQFYYYPAAGVYRDCDEDRWLWSEDGGETWTCGPRLPAQFHVGGEIPFAVSLSMNDPAAEHRAIAAAFPPAGGMTPATATVQGSNDFEN